MIAPEIKDFEVYKASGKKLVYLMVTLWDEGDTKTNGEILAEYEIEIYDAYANYKITKKTYHETITIKQPRQCDEQLVKLYEANYFEDDYVSEYNEDEFTPDWAI